MCKYEMDRVSIIEDIEQTWFCPQTDRRMDKGDTIIPRFQLQWSGGYKICKQFQHLSLIHLLDKACWVPCLWLAEVPMVRDSMLWYQRLISLKVFGLHFKFDGNKFLLTSWHRNVLYMPQLLCQVQNFVEIILLKIKTRAKWKLHQIWIAVLKIQ